MKFRRSLLLVSLLSLLPSCGVVAGAGLGYVLSREVLPGAVHEAHVSVDVDQVWPLTLESLEILQDLGTDVVISEDERHVQAEVDGSEVQVDVLAHDFERSVVRVKARGALADDPATANLVMQNILDRLEREAIARPASASR